MASSPLTTISAFPTRAGVRIREVWRAVGGDASTRDVLAQGWPFAALFVATLSYSLLSGRVNDAFDAAALRQGAASFSNNGGFSLAAWGSAEHGYLVPLFHHALDSLASSMAVPADVALKVALALIFAWVSTVAVPGFASAMFEARSTPVRRVVMGVLFLVFWHGFALYLTTDLLALACLLTGTALVARWRRQQNPGWSRLQIGAAGMWLGAAALSRPPYAVSSLVVLALLVVAVRERRTHVHPLVPATWITIGAAVVLVPQVHINRAHDRSWNPLAFTTPEGGSRVYAALDTGLRARERATGRDDAGSSVGTLRSPDPRGALIHQELLRCCEVSAVNGRANSDEAIVAEQRFTYGGYARAVFDRPASFILLYGRHLRDGLDLRHGTPFPASWGASNPWLRGANTVVWVLAAIIAVIVLRALRLSRTLDRSAAVAALLVLVLPVLVVVPAPVQDRAYLPLFVAAYTLAVYGTPRLLRQVWKSPRRARRARPT